jgi:small subunit ribosomal protein S16
MALRIRLSRGGTKKRPHYAIVIAESRSPRDGRFIEKIGFYNPLLPKDHAERLRLDIDAAKAWMAKGATATDRVHRFLSDAGVLEKRVHNNPEKAAPKKKAQERTEAAAKAAAKAAAAAAAPKEETPAAEAPAAEAPAEEVPAAEAPAEEAPPEEKAEG